MLKITPFHQCSRCLFTSDMCFIPEKGQCEYCDLQDMLRSQSSPDDWPKVLSQIKQSGKNNQYDVLIGISGGEDSSIMLHMAVEAWGLRPLVIHFNNRSNRPEADNNIRLITNYYHVNFIEYFVDQKEYDSLTDSFLMAGLPDADIPNDIAMAKLMYETAKTHHIKYILNGHDYAREGSSPRAWSYMDAKYLQDVYKQHTGKKLKNYPLYTLWDQIVSGLIGIKQVRPFHYYPDFNRSIVLEKLKKIGWQDYGGKHNENIYTAFVGNFLLPKKFKIDKRITYLSAQIREGMMTKDQAEEILKTPAVFDLNDLGNRKEIIMALVNTSPHGRRNDYARYNFTILKPLIWVLARLKIVPWTFFKKYTK